MVTQNFKNLMASMLESNNTVIGVTPVRDVSGRRRYATNYFSNTSNFPYGGNWTFTLDVNGSGVCIGTGSEPPNEEDYNLQEHITGGVAMLLISREIGQENGCPILTYTFSIANTTQDTLIVREVGYKQPFNCANGPGRLSASNTDNTGNYVLLLDRTLLDTPMVILPGDVGILVYKLKTIPRADKTVNGVKIVSFEYGTDAEIADMLDAAKNGTIDLYRDAGWRVGDMRKIFVSSFMAGGNITEPDQYIEIVISSFDEYNGCGNVMQFDFMNTLSNAVRMHPSAMENNNYGETEMKTVTLPALVNSLPEWLRTRLVTFDVETAKGTVTDNKLALRSGAEICNVDITGVKENEGEFTDMFRVIGTSKRIGYNGAYTNNTDWWLRTINNNSSYYIASRNNDRFYNDNVTSKHYIAPFGCI